MQRLMILIVNAPIRSILAALLFTFMFAMGLNDVVLDSSTKSLLTKGDLDVEYLEEIKDVFGDAVIHSIIFKSNTVFREDILKRVLDMTYDAEEINGVERVVSMATVSNLKGEDGTLNTDMLLMDLPWDSVEMAVLKQDTLSNPMFVGEIINPAGTVTGLHLFLNNRGDENNFDNRILNEIEILVRKARKGLSDDVEIYHIGTSKLKADMINAMNYDSVHLVPMAGGMVAIVLFYFFRTGVAVLIPILTGILSIISTLGFMGTMGFAINPVSVIIPTLLFVMGSTEDIHLISEYMHELEKGETKNKAILNMGVKSGTAILLTSLTTLLGFATIIPNPTPILSEFGITASFGIAMNFIITILTVPAVLKLFGAPKAVVKKENIPIKYIRQFLFVCITRYRFYVGGFLLICIGLSLMGIQKVYIETDYVKFFQKDADVPVLLGKLNRDLVGGTNFMVVVESKDPDVFQTHDGLKQITLLQEYLSEYHGKAVGYVDIVRRTHQEMNNGEEKFFVIPDNDDLIAQYNLMMDADNLSRFVNHNFSKTSILVKTRASGTQEIMDAYNDINQFVGEKLSRDLDYHVTGEIIVVAKASNSMTREVVFCLGLMFCTIFLLSSIMFFSLKAGALAIIPNILPVLVTFGFMGFMGIPLSVATFPVAIIALGIAVDDTIHFMIRYAGELKNADSNELSIMNTMKMEIRPILSTSTALITGFLTLLFGQFGSTIQFGKLTALCILAALICDLLITPMLLLKIPIISPVDMLFTYIGKKLTYSRCNLLKDLKKSEILRILAMGKIKVIENGRQFITHGEASHNMVLILDGKVDVVREDTREIVTSLKSGDIVGEMGFVTDEPRSASVVTRSKVEAFEIDKKLIQLVANRFPRIGTRLFFNISQILSQRLKERDGG